jgi:hypothetical protein
MKTIFSRHCSGEWEIPPIDFLRRQYPVIAPWMTPPTIFGVLILVLMILGKVVGGDKAFGGWVFWVVTVVLLVGCWGVVFFAALSRYFVHSKIIYVDTTNYVVFRVGNGVDARVVLEFVREAEREDCLGRISRALISRFGDGARQFLWSPVSFISFEVEEFSQEMSSTRFLFSGVRKASWRKVLLERSRQLNYSETSKALVHELSHIAIEKMFPTMSETSQHRVMKDLGLY